MFILMGMQNIGPAISSFKQGSEIAERATAAGDEGTAVQANAQAAIAKATYESIVAHFKAGLDMLRKSNDLMT